MPCEQQDGHEGVQNRILKGFCGRGLRFRFVFGLVSRSFFVLGLPKSGVRMESIAKTTFRRNHFFMDMGPSFIVVRSPWEQFF